MAYALESDHRDRLKGRVELIRSAAKDVGWACYFHVADGQNWQAVQNPDFSQILADVFEMIKNADAVLLDLTSHANSRRTGLNIEAGYAAALGKPIIGIYHADDAPRMTLALAQQARSYTVDSEIGDCVRDLLESLRVAPVR